MKKEKNDIQTYLVTFIWLTLRQLALFHNRTISVGAVFG